MSMMFDQLQITSMTTGPATSKQAGHQQEAAQRASPQHKYYETYFSQLAKLTLSRPPLQKQEDSNSRFAGQTTCKAKGALISCTRPALSQAIVFTDFLLEAGPPCW